jgi:hypothetical protein
VLQSLGGITDFLAEKSAISENPATLSFAISSYSNASCTVRPLHYRSGAMLKIEKTLSERGTIIKLMYPQSRLAGELSVACISSFG